MSTTYHLEIVIKTDSPIEVPMGAASAFPPTAFHDAVVAETKTLLALVAVRATGYFYLFTAVPTDKHTVSLEVQAARGIELPPALGLRVVDSSSYDRRVDLSQDPAPVVQGQGRKEGKKNGPAPRPARYRRFQHQPSVAVIDEEPKKPQPAPAMIDEEPKKPQPAPAVIDGKPKKPQPTPRPPRRRRRRNLRQASVTAVAGDQ